MLIPYMLSNWPCVHFCVFIVISRSLMHLCYWLCLCFSQWKIKNTEIDNEVSQRAPQTEVIGIKYSVVLWYIRNLSHFWGYQISIGSLYWNFSFYPYQYHMICNITDREHIYTVGLIYIYISLQFALYNISNPLILC